MKTNLTRPQTREAIAAREDFTNTGKSVTGIKGIPVLPRDHQLNSVERERFLDDMRDITYTVLSYNTPIAWEKSDGSRYRVSQFFSMTTSKHMGLCFTASPAKVEA